MSFGGGGSGALPNHEHTNIALDGGPLDFVNTTIASLTANSMTYSDGAALQELTIGSDAQVLGVSGGSPTWITNTSNPLIKVSKTFADIVIGSTSMDIYDLPEDSALVNVWVDITTAFDVSTGVTIGDGSDDNGFQEATDWTAGIGLTDATRGVYVTTFKTMRSTSGTTSIKAYNFSTAGGTGTEFIQNDSSDGGNLNNWQEVQFCQLYQAGHVLIGEDVCKASFYIKQGSGTPGGTITAMIRESDGTLKASSTTFLDATTITGSYVEYTFDFPSTTINADDMICVNTESLTGAFTVVVEFNGANMPNGEMYNTSAAGAYAQIDPGELRQTVTYDCSPVTTDTQGAVDFYLQVVD